MSTLRSAGRCKTCRNPMVTRPYCATVDILPPGYRFHTGRGLCTSCFDAAKRRGELVDFERTTRSRDDLLDDWVIARADGLTYQQFADRIGSSKAAVERALARARVAGDPRALHSIPALHHMGVPA